VEEAHGFSGLCREVGFGYLLRLPGETASKGLQERGVGPFDAEVLVEQDTFALKKQVIGILIFATKVLWSCSLIIK
tara:strand:+ start:451 stop:678 length:228 start_codon:yes stop_codon:yes gene_type:complete